jgi:hypothetical protein
MCSPLLEFWEGLWNDCRRSVQGNTDVYHLLKNRRSARNSVPKASGHKVRLKTSVLQALGVICRLRKCCNHAAEVSPIKTVLKRCIAVISWIASRTLSDAGHVIRMMISTSNYARATRRAQSSSMHICCKQDHPQPNCPDWVFR